MILTKSETFTLTLTSEELTVLKRCLENDKRDVEKGEIAKWEEEILEHIRAALFFVCGDAEEDTIDANVARDDQRKAAVSDGDVRE